MWNLNELLDLQIIFKLIFGIDGWDISCIFALRWLSLDLTNDMLTLVQVMAWCRQATSHYLSRYWPSSVSPHSISRPQWINGNFLLALMTNSTIKSLALLIWTYFTNFNSKRHPSSHLWAHISPIPASHDVSVWTKLTVVITGLWCILMPIISYKTSCTICDNPPVFTTPPTSRINRT